MSEVIYVCMYVSLYVCICLYEYMHVCLYACILFDDKEINLINYRATFSSLYQSCKWFNEEIMYRNATMTA